MPTTTAPAKVHYRPLTETGESTVDQLPFQFRDWVIANHLPDLIEIKIGFCFHQNLKPDRENLVTLGMCRIQSDPVRQMTGIDALVILNQEWWNDHATTDEQRKALVHHELSHIGIHKDDQGDAKKDELGRVRMYPKKHDISEFRGVIDVHGIYVEDLREAYRSLRAAADEEDLSNTAAETDEVVNATLPT
jgi:hypothetical protein